MLGRKDDFWLVANVAVVVAFASLGQNFCATDVDSDWIKSSASETMVSSVVVIYNLKRWAAGVVCDKPSKQANRMPTSKL